MASLCLTLKEKDEKERKFRDSKTLKLFIQRTVSEEALNPFVSGKVF